MAETNNITIQDYHAIKLIQDLDLYLTINPDTKHYLKHKIVWLAKLIAKQHNIIRYEHSTENSDAETEN